MAEAKKKTPTWRSRRKELDRQQQAIDLLRAQAQADNSGGSFVGGGGGHGMFGDRPKIYVPKQDEWGVAGQALQGLLASQQQRNQDKVERALEGEMVEDQQRRIEAMFGRPPEAAQGPAVPAYGPSAGGTMGSPNPTALDIGMPPPGGFQPQLLPQPGAMMPGMGTLGGAPVNPPLGAAQAVQPALPLSARPTSTPTPEQAAVLAQTLGGVSSPGSASSLGGDPEQALVERMHALQQLQIDEDKQIARDQLLQEADEQIARNAALLSQPPSGPYVKGAQTTIPSSGTMSSSQGAREISLNPAPSPRTPPPGFGSLPGTYRNEADLHGLMGDIPPEQPKTAHLDELDREIARTTDPKIMKVLMDERDNLAASLAGAPLTVPQSEGELSPIDVGGPEVGMLEVRAQRGPALPAAVAQSTSLPSEPTSIPQHALPQVMKVSGGMDDDWRAMMHWAGNAAVNPLMESLAKSTWDKGMLTWSQQATEASKQLLKSQMQTLGLSSDDPAAVREFKYFMSLPRAQQEQYMAVKRAAQIMNLGGTQAVRGPMGGIAEQYVVTPKPGEMPAFQAAQTTAVESAKAAVEKEAARLAAMAAYRAAVRKSDETIAAIDSTLKDVNQMSAGLPAQATVGIGQTPAYNLKAKLVTLGAKFAFEAMAELKAASPTGATGLGAIAIKEFEALQNATGAIDQFQDPDQLKDQLRLIRMHMQNIRGLIDQAHKERWGTDAVPAAPAAPATAVPQGPVKRYNPVTGRIE